jgi:cobalt-zinc-cadmium efflux system membrane fusion protein
MNRASLLAPLALLAAACGSSQAARPSGPPPGQVWLTEAQVKEARVEVAPVGEQVVDDSIVTSGVVTLDDLRTGHVFSPVTGRVVSIAAQLGQRVKKGDPLAVIASPEIGTAVSDVHKAQADLTMAEHDLRRKKELYLERAASAADVEGSEDQQRKAKAELERARQKQALLRIGNVDRVTQSYSLPSPIDGEILLRNINPGIEVQGQYSGGAAQELFTIGELDRVWVLADVYEIDLARVHLGAPAAVSLVAYPDKTYGGTIDWVSGSLDPSTRTAKVRCTFENPDKALRPLMYSAVKLSADPRKALAIPRSALVQLGEYKMVFVEVGDGDGQIRFERLPVDVADAPATTQTGLPTGPWVEVRHGVDAGQKIVVSGASVLLQRMGAQ